MIALNIIIVGYNEEENLPKLFSSLLHLVRQDFHLRVIYVDQASTDDSVHIAQKHNAEVYTHPNLGYADPDKKWAVEELCSDNEWCMILDADEEISESLAQEMSELLAVGEYDIYKMYREIYFMEIVSNKSYEPRIFRKGTMQFTNTIHYYMTPLSDKIGVLTATLKSYNKKDYGKDIDHLEKKMNLYAEKEVAKHTDSSNIRILFSLILMPIIHFFGWGIRHRLFLRGARGYIVCAMMAHYQFLIYAKAYEYKNIRP